MRSKPACPRLAALLLLLLLVAVTPASAGNTGSFRIEVLSSEGSPLASARVTVTDPANHGFRLEASTDERGRADLLGLPPRPYVFIVSLEGFVSYESNFQAVAGERADRKVRLTRIGEGSPVSPGGAGKGNPTGDGATSAYNEAVAHYRADRMVEALASVETALQAEPGAPAAAALKGIILESSGRCEEAIPLLEKSAAASPPRKEALQPLIRCLEGAGRKEEAAGYRKLLASLGRSPADLYNEAVVAINAGNDEVALGLLQEALGLDGNLAPALFQYALILMRRGDTATTLTWLERYLALAPDGEFAADARELIRALKP